MNLEFFRSIYNSENLRLWELEKLAESHSKTNFSKGDLVLKKGQISNEYYLIEAGLFRSFVFDYSGREITTNFFGEKEILIEALSLFQRIASKEYIEALTDAVVWKIDFQKFQDLYHSIDAFDEWGRSWMSNELFDCKQRSVEMLTLSATERYLKLMEQRPDIFSQAPLKHIASFLGVTDSSLSRIRKEIVGS